MRRWSGQLATLLFKLVATLVIIAIPLLGVWAGSSLATYAGGPLWAAVVAGLVLFPVGPFAWEGIAAWRRSRKDTPRPRILTLWDRVILRTFVLSFVLLGAFLAAQPEAIFTALSTRGDWFLEGRTDDGAEAVRRRVLATADGLAWLYEVAHENPFADETADDDGEAPPPVPNEGLPLRRGDDERNEDDADHATATTGDTDSATPDASDSAPSGTAPTPPPRTWPFETKLHPLVETMPRAVEASIASVAEYIRDREPDPFLRVKALHDWVADRIAYDAVSLAAGEYPPQDAESVFRERKAVCAGYAYLLRALGEAAGEEIVYVTGDSRTEGSELSGIGHAWNAVRIDGGWYLLDATWNAGSVEGNRFDKRYSTLYFLTPPEVFGVSHFPDEPRWQLRDAPLTRGEFNRQPNMRPSFYAAHLRLIRPDRSQVTTAGSLRLELANPLGAFLMADVRPRGSMRDHGTACPISGTRPVKVDCTLHGTGTYEVMLFQSYEPYGTYEWSGAIEAINR